MQARARVPRAQFGEQGISNWSDLEADDVGVEGVEEAAERAVLRHPRPQPVNVVSHYLQHLPPPPRGVTPGTGHAEAREGNVSLFSGAGAGRREPAAGAAAAPVVVGTACGPDKARRRQAIPVRLGPRHSRPMGVVTGKAEI
jgi:hypothetical protein